MRMFVLISRFQRALDEINRSLAPHSAWVLQQYESGRFLVSGRREPPRGASVGGPTAETVIDRIRGV